MEWKSELPEKTKFEQSFLTPVCLTLRMGGCNTGDQCSYAEMRFAGSLGIVYTNLSNIHLHLNLFNFLSFPAHCQSAVLCLL